MRFHVAGHLDDAHLDNAQSLLSEFFGELLRVLDMLDLLIFGKACGIVLSCCCPLVDLVVVCW